MGTSGARPEVWSYGLRNPWRFSFDRATGDLHRVYRGAAVPSLQGQYFYADFCQGWVRSFRAEANAIGEESDWPTLTPRGNVTSFGEPR